MFPFSPSFLHPLIRFLILFALELLLCPTFLPPLGGGASQSAASRDELFSSEQRWHCVVDEPRPGCGPASPAPEQTHPLRDCCLCSAVLHPLKGGRGCTVPERSLPCHGHGACPAGPTLSPPEPGAAQEGERGQRGGSPRSDLSRTSCVTSSQIT